MTNDAAHNAIGPRRGSARVVRRLGQVNSSLERQPTLQTRVWRPGILESNL